MVGEAVYGRGRAGPGIDGRGNDDREKDIVPCMYNYIFCEIFEMKVL